MSTQFNFSQIQSNLVAGHPRRSFIVSFATMLVPLFILSYGKGHNIAGVSMILPALFLAFPIKKSMLPEEFKWLSLCFWIYFLIFPLSVLIKGGSMSDIDQPSRFVLALLICLMLLKYPPKIHYLIVGFSLGSSIGFFIAYIQIHYFSFSRGLAATKYPSFKGEAIGWFKGFMPIQDGDIAMTLGLITLFFVPYMFKQKDLFLRPQKRISPVLVLIAACFGLMASIFSGSRGAWVTSPILLAGFLFANRDMLISKVSKIGVILVLTAGIIGISQSNMVQNRIQQAHADLIQLAQGNENSSVGKRLMLWKSALTTTAENPIFGAGYDGRIESRKAQVARGEMPAQNDYWLQVHAHNEYLEALSVFGVIGLLALMGVFLVPLYLHLKHKPENEAQRVLNQCGIVNIVATMGYGMTQVFLGHNSGAIFYPVMVVIFLTASGAIRLKEDKTLQLK